MEKKRNGWKFFAMFLMGTVVGLLASPALNGVKMKNICCNEITSDKFNKICEDDCDCDDEDCDCK